MFNTHLLLISLFSANSYINMILYATTKVQKVSKE